jgi:hypothetical protein
MSLPLLCQGTILALTCPTSCQPSCSLPPLSGSIEVAWFHPFSRSTTAPTRSCFVVPTPSPSESGRVSSWSPSAALRPAQLRMPRLAACVATADRRVNAQVFLPQPTGSHFQTHWFLHLPLLRRHHATVLELFSYPGEEVFARPGPATPSQPPQMRYPSCQWAPPQRLDL